MEEFGKKISAAGAFLALIGILSSVLYLINFNLKILAWIDIWGVGVGWVIRLGLILGGAALFFVFAGKGDGEKGEHGEGGGGDGDEDEDEDEDWDTYRAKVKADPRFAQLLAQVQQSHPTTFDDPPDGDTYQIVHYQFTNDTGQPLSPEDDSILYLSIYLKRKNKPQRLQVGTTLATGELVTTELSGMQWSYVVP
ncbi:MAG: hypothetical protein ABI333_01220 [bacterium]